MNGGVTPYASRRRPSLTPEDPQPRRDGGALRRERHYFGSNFSATPFMQ